MAKQEELPIERAEELGDLFEAKKPLLLPKQHVNQAPGQQRMAGSADLRISCCIVVGIGKGRWKLSEPRSTKASELENYLEQLCTTVKQVRYGVMAGIRGTFDSEV